jgi:transposase
MERSPFLPLPEGMVLGQVELAQTQLIVEVISTQPCAHCPGCGNSSDAVHWKSQRTVHDVPCGGRKVVLRLKVRKFFCRTPSCPRHPCLPNGFQSWFGLGPESAIGGTEELKAIGLAASAEVSERLAPRLGMQVKAPTRLALPTHDPSPSRCSHARRGD